MRDLNGRISDVSFTYTNTPGHYRVHLDDELLGWACKDGYARWTARTADGERLPRVFASRGEAIEALVHAGERIDKRQ